MWLPSFELHRPADLSEALRLRAELGAEFRPLAGGTDLLPNYKWRIEKKPHLLSLADVPELGSIEEVRRYSVASCQYCRFSDYGWNFFETEQLSDRELPVELRKFLRVQEMIQREHRSFSTHLLACKL